MLLSGRIYYWICWRDCDAANDLWQWACLRLLQAEHMNAVLIDHKLTERSIIGAVAHVQHSQHAVHRAANLILLQHNHVFIKQANCSVRQINL